jgi:hypothetical protein
MSNLQIHRPWFIQVCKLLPTLGCSIEDSYDSKTPEMSVAKSPSPRARKIPATASRKSISPRVAGMSS